MKSLMKTLVFSVLAALAFLFLHEAVTFAERVVWFFSAFAMVSAALSTLND